MLEKIVITALIVYAIWYTMQPREIFSRLSGFLERLPYPLHAPLFECSICMSPWYGTAIYWTVWGHSWLEWLVCVIAAMGLNAWVVRLSSQKDD